MLLFFLFGGFFANETFATFRTIRYASISLAEARIDIFGPLVTFAFSAFLVVIFIHGGQWIVSARLQSKMTSIMSRDDNSR